MQLTRYHELIHRKPDAEVRGARVWTLRQDATARVNLVEMPAELPLHRHPDACHTILVLEGRLRAQVGDGLIELSPGDYLSIPADVPHKYWSVTPKAYLVSMDAPYYDPKKTIWLE
jgi:quercetin dioxygenase-like cupin family protein